ncbi:CAMK/PKD protein kinase [Sphaeroforma arctica JP610]|uniref:CAMK/PKD protein kinase n=1 Tax=Sphaeroforma arctica JP610 TaxID=667725 RepID=A0A0L0FT12_9EUKA|nr:CAMK/PKD protein kinase [Sphaeroforma arctica JP610]KNC79824.1 CAMK/PKD protein kinase [Sphaeroforma arctica JP610]|eukprot:XP_014153726.1 CAMK/PKD protein kinase [Sphaeroforma arctica JP610]
MMYNLSGNLDVLPRITDLSQIGDGGEIVVVRMPTRVRELNQNAHRLMVKSYTEKRGCNFCNQQLFGINRQGLHCTACNLDYHKKCVYSKANKCEHANAAVIFKVPHRFVQHEFDVGVKCTYCRLQFLAGQTQGSKCEDCYYNCHTPCILYAPSCIDGAQFVDERADISGGDIQMRQASNMIPLHRVLTSKVSTVGTGALPPGANYTSDRSISIMGHVFVPGVFNGPTFCNKCGSQVEGGASNALECNKCYCVAHSECMASYHCVVDASDATLASGVVRMGEKDSDHMVERCLRIMNFRLQFYLDENAPKPMAEIKMKNIQGLATIKMDNARAMLLSVDGKLYQLEASSAEIIGRLVSAINTTIRYVSLNSDAFDHTRMADNLPGSGAQPPAQVSAESRDSMGNNRRLEDDYIYDLNTPLGSGQFGMVVAAQDAKNPSRHMAIKIIQWKKIVDADHSKTANLKSEMALLKALKNPNIISLERIYHTPEVLYLVMERAFGGDLLDRILSQPNQSLSEPVAKYYIYQILTALKFLHDNKVAHRDLKPENVLLSTNDTHTLVKLCDFGFARIVGENSFMQSVVGTPAYVAPEVIRQSSGSAATGYQVKVDLWSLGVIVYVALSGTFPYNEEQEVAQQIFTANFLFPDEKWANISNEAKHLIHNTLKVDYNERYSTEQALNSSWFRSDKRLRMQLEQLEEAFRTGPNHYQLDKYIPA